MDADIYIPFLPNSGLYQIKLSCSPWFNSMQGTLVSDGHPDDPFLPPSPIHHQQINDYIGTAANQGLNGSVGTAQGLEPWGHWFQF